MKIFYWLFSLLLASPAFSDPLAYIGTLDDRSVTLVWGDPAKKGNPIGRNGDGLGEVAVHIGGKVISSTQSWLKISDLQPNTAYSYSIRKDNSVIAEGTIRTWPDKTTSLVFFVIGDWGNGSTDQYKLAQKMEAERQRLRAEGKEVRFILSTGDNIYGLWKSGKNDREWIPKFFIPYAQTLKEIPFYAVLGNHDGNESERTEDLNVYLDNFFFPGEQPARWYRFQYGNFAEFIALDSTRNQPQRPRAPIYTQDGEQSQWLKEQLSKDSLEWRFIVMHHPMFTAGPDHPPFLENAPHWFQLFQTSDVSAVFSGHEHNFQYSAPQQDNGNIAWFVSGAGGQLRAGNVSSVMNKRRINAWAPHRHFLIVEVNEGKMLVTPVSADFMKILNSEGSTVFPSFHVEKKEK